MNKSEQSDQDLKPFDKRRNEFMQHLYQKYQFRPVSNFSFCNSETSERRTRVFYDKEDTESRSSYRRPFTQPLFKPKKLNLNPTFLSTNLKNINVNRITPPELDQSLNKNNILPNFNNQNLNDSNFHKNLKYFVHNKNLIKLKAFLLINPVQIKKPIQTKTDQEFKQPSFTIPKKNERKIKIHFKKIVKVVVIILRVLSIHRTSRQKIENSKETPEIILNLIHNNEIFEKEIFSRPKEPTFPDEAKKLLMIDPNERSEDIIRHIMLSLNFSVPEFIEYPMYMQRMIAKYSYYQEFEPGRVIIRQGHLPDNYYIIISGNALEMQTKSSFLGMDDFEYSPISALKRGDTFGDKSIINNTLRTSSVTVHGSKPISLLCIEKEDFYRIQTPVANDNEKLDFLKTKVTMLKTLNYPIDALVADNIKNRAFCSIYYKKGTIICENSQASDWLYVNKSGSCKVLKRVKFNLEALNLYLKKNENKLDRIQKLYVKDDNNKIVPLPKEKIASLNANDLKDKYVYLEMNKLKEGDIFGLHDIILTQEEDDKVPLIITSDGIECLLINKRYFLKHLPSKSLITLRFSLYPYPADEYLTNKYFHSFKWKDFRNSCRLDTIKKLKNAKLSKKSVYFF